MKLTETYEYTFMYVNVIKSTSGQSIVEESILLSILLFPHLQFVLDLNPH